MSGSTSAPWSIPYPTGTDRVADGDNAMQSLAERVSVLLNAPPLTVGYSGLALNTGWSGGVAYAARSGWVHVWVSASKASWILGEYLISVPVPVGSRPNYNLYFVGMDIDQGRAVPLQINTSGGILAGQGSAALSVSGGIVAHTAYPAMA